jgi:hypothetical protein
MPVGGGPITSRVAASMPTYTNLVRRPAPPSTPGAGLWPQAVLRLGLTAADRTAKFDKLPRDRKSGTGLNRLGAGHLPDLVHPIGAEPSTRPPPWCPTAIARNPQFEPRTPAPNP